MEKKILGLNCIIMLIIVLIGLVMNQAINSLIFGLGMINCSVNLFVNKYIIHQELTRKRLLFAFVIKVIITLIIGISLALVNVYYCITFIIGYTVGIVPIVIIVSKDWKRE